jgi:pantoate--beta-alanine ligase
MTLRIETINEMKNAVNNALKENKTVGFVPTMGYLHDGHLSLVRRCVKENDITVVSIFVNPIQFGRGEDLDSYPRDIKHDMELLEKAKVDYVFVPSLSQMYPKGYDTFVNVYGVTEGLCGSSRPTHFMGVCTVVAKLFNICRPTRAYFGQKDFQQTVVVKKMAADLDMDTQITVCPTVRESDGLAMSSRNSYLTADLRRNAGIIYKALKTAEMTVLNGETDCTAVKKIIADMIGRNKDARIEYIEIRKQTDLSLIDKIINEAVIAVAVKIGDTRLIDNILVGGKCDADHRS